MNNTRLPESPFEERISDYLRTLIQKENWEFYGNNQLLRPEEVAGVNCWLPAILFGAEMKVKEIYSADASLGLRFRKVKNIEESLMGVVPTFESTLAKPGDGHGEQRLGRIYAYLVPMHLLIEAREKHNYYNGPSLDHLYDMFAEAYENKTLPLIDDGPSRQKTPTPDVTGY